MDNIDDEYERFVEHLHDCTKKAKSFKTTNKRLSLKTLELIRQRGAARAAGNQEPTRMVKVIHDFYSDLFDNHVQLPPYHLKEDGRVIPSFFPPKSDMRRIVLHPVPTESSLNITDTLARLFTRYLSECRVSKQWKTSKTVLLYKKGDPQDIGNCCPICLLSVNDKLFTRVILNRIERSLDEGQSCEQAVFRKGFSTIDRIHTVSKLIEV
ncbi:hypothetical protein RB195_007377 [Necator americanus]|uniref:Reverse transcriptase domain-containing protein n=1 Tax=Necator americanus TaxID=51031 RepID=A0ABR1BZQ3_NECAM